ncbi:uncharacterized protein LOC106055845 isoform X1 [Biomphalaria glabrata]|uniref:Uncharacterized protein LOC106055845 isoform X1 n=1 Tax=Biomphalaria glabrata TaxID=6526 RepID=A0A9W3ASB0_BIOGL|nr:uncharacterized protein LOC106055845 isoform X1 [Biomphalaria glabrata]
MLYSGQKSLINNRYLLSLFLLKVDNSMLVLCETNIHPREVKSSEFIPEIEGLPEASYNVEENTFALFCKWANMKKYYGLCYKYFYNRLTRKKAEMQCQVMNGHLAHIADPFDMPYFKYQWNFSFFYWVGVKLESHNGCVAYSSNGSFLPKNCLLPLPYICMFRDEAFSRMLLKQSKNIYLMKRSSYHSILVIVFVLTLLSLPCLIIPTSNKHNRKSDQSNVSESHIQCRRDTSSVHDFNAENLDWKKSVSDDEVIQMYNEMVAAKLKNASHKNSVSSKYSTQSYSTVHSNLSK